MLRLLEPSYLWCLVFLPVLWLLLRHNQGPQKSQVSSLLLFQFLKQSQLTRTRHSIISPLLLCLIGFVLASVLYMAGLTWVPSVKDKVNVTAVYVDDSLRMRHEFDGKALYQGAAKELHKWVLTQPDDTLLDFYYSSGRTAKKVAVQDVQDVGALELLLQAQFHADDSLEKQWFASDVAKGIYVGTNEKLAEHFSRYILCGGKSDNVGIVEFYVETVESGQSRCFFEIENFSDTDVTLSWQLQVGENIIASKQTAIVANGQQGFVAVVQRVTGTLTLSIDRADQFSFDNRVEAKPIEQARVGLLAESRIDLYNRLAAAVGFDLVLAGSEDFTDYNFLLVDAMEVPDEKVPVLAFVPKGLSGFKLKDGVNQGRLHYAPAGDPWRRLQLDEVYVSELQVYDVPSSWEVLLFVGDGVPAIVRNGDSVVVLFDLEKSDWLAKESFPIFVNQVISSGSTQVAWSIVRLDKLVGASDAERTVNVLSTAQSGVSRRYANHMDFDGDENELAREASAPMRGLLWLAFMLLCLSVLMRRRVLRWR